MAKDTGKEQQGKAVAKEALAHGSNKKSAKQPNGAGKAQEHPKQQPKQLAYDPNKKLDKAKPQQKAAVQAAPKQQPAAAAEGKKLPPKRPSQGKPAAKGSSQEHHEQQPAAAPLQTAVATGNSAPKREKAAKRSGQGKPAADGSNQQPASAAAAAATVVAAPSKAGAVSSNWQQLKATIAASSSKDGAGKKGLKRKGPGEGAEARPGKKPRSVGSNTGVTPVLAMDCEMVGVGPEGDRSALARVCVVNEAGNVLLDKFVVPKEKVTDYRTRYSGVRPADLRPESGAITLEEAQQRVAEFIKGRILVGHSIQNDLRALMLDHPRKEIRDTATYPPLMHASAPGRKPRPRALRHLAAEQLGLVIQEGEHSPVDDARATLYIYQRHRKEWEQAIRTGSIKRQMEGVKTARKAAVAAAAAAATAAAGSASITAAATVASLAAVGAPVAAAGLGVDPRAALTAGQLRALRTGKKIKVTGGKGKGGAAMAGAGAPGGRHPMAVDDDEVRELMAQAAAAAATAGVQQKSRGRGKAVDIFTRDVRDDPLADL